MDEANEKQLPDLPWTEEHENILVDCIEKTNLELKEQPKMQLDRVLLVLRY